MSKRVIQIELILKGKLSEINPPLRKRRKSGNNHNNFSSPYQTISTTIVSSHHPKLSLFSNVFAMMSNITMINTNDNLKNIKLWDNLLYKFGSDTFKRNMSHIIVNCLHHIDRNAKWKTIRTIKAKYNNFEVVKYNLRNM